jgi:hypothetical protein
MKKIALATLVFVGVVAPVGADVIFDNGGPDLSTSAVISTLGDGLLVVADDFLLQAGASTVTDVHWYGAYGSNLVSDFDDFTIRFLADIGGDPEPTPSVLDLNVGNVGRELVAVNAFGLDVFGYWVDIDALTLNAGDVYYISIVNNHDVVGGTGWGWHYSDADPELSWSRFDDTGPWSQRGGTGVAFSLTGPEPVPEPATMTLMGLGLAGLAYRSRRQKA